MKMNRALGRIQESLTATRDEICQLAFGRIKAGLMTFVRTNPIPDLQQLELVSSAPLASLLKPSSNSAKYAALYNLSSLHSLQAHLGQGIIPRQRITNILRAMPSNIARIVRNGNVINSQVQYSLITNNGSHDLMVASTKDIKQALMAMKFPDLTVDINNIHRRLDLPIPGTAEFSALFSGIWKIKNPALRAIRLKLCYKDIFSNERRHRFGIADSPECSVCNQIETVEHQLYECQNARRLWQMFQAVTGVGPRSFRDIFLYNSNSECEIVKSVIIKALIQIDRSKNSPDKAIASLCSHFLRIEAARKSMNERPCADLISKLNLIQ